MAVLPARFNRIKEVLDKRIENLTVLVEAVNKPHNLSAILRTCDAAGIFNANFICEKNKISSNRVFDYFLTEANICPIFKLNFYSQIVKYRFTNE